MMIAWEAAVPPCLCAIVALVTYVTLVRLFALLDSLIAVILSHWLTYCICGFVQLEKNWWETMFQAVLGKLYVISLLATL